MEKIMKTEFELTAKIEKLMAIFDGEKKISEGEYQRYLNSIKELVPNSLFIDIYFYPEIERTAEEMAQEALLRERIFVEGGKEALNEHIKKSYYKALERSDTKLSELVSIHDVLRGIEGRDVPGLSERIEKLHREMFPK
jgi:hypothetical protein